LKNFAHNNKMAVGCFRVTRALAYATQSVTQQSACVIVLVSTGELL